MKRALCIRGLTMMELLAVIVIVSLMLALSAAAYWRMSRSFKEQSALADLDVALRQARNSAIANNAPAFVEINTAERRVVPWVYSTVGMWHFETRDSYGKTGGARGRDAVMRGAELFPDGKIGKCARVRDNGFVDLGSDPDLDCEDGGVLEAYIRPATYTFTGDNYIFFKKGAYSLKIGLGGILSGNAGNKTLKAEDYRVVPGRWTKVGFAWDRYSTRILVDDGIVAIGPGAKPPISTEPLLVGHDTGSLEGLVDEVRVMSASAGNALNLPPSYTVKHNAAPWNAIYFAADGTLDMHYHAGPLAITLTQDRRARTVTISMMGQTARQEVEKLEPEESASAPVVAERPPDKSKLTIYADGEAPKKKSANATGKGGTP